VVNNEQVVTNMVMAHTAQFTYAMGSEMTQVVLPFINTAAHGDIQSYGLYRSLTGLVQTIGGVAFGRFVDVYGVKASMVTAHSAALAYFAVLATASSQLSFPKPSACSSYAWLPGHSDGSCIIGPS
jgi:MFS family permease